jgi:hypothetical protein
MRSSARSNASIKLRGIDSNGRPVTFARARRYQSIKYVSQIQLCKLRVDPRAKDVSRDVDEQGSVLAGSACAVPSGNLDPARFRLDFCADALMRGGPSISSSLCYRRVARRFLHGNARRGARKAGFSTGALEAPMLNASASNAV